MFRVMTKEEMLNNPMFDIEERNVNEFCAWIKDEHEHYCDGVGLHQIWWGSPIRNILITPLAQTVSVDIYEYYGTPRQVEGSVNIDKRFIVED